MSATATASGSRFEEDGFSIIKFEVPPISDEMLKALLKRIKPVVRKNGELYYIKQVHPRNIAFTWDPKTTRKAKNLVKIGSIPTLHVWGYYGLFKPSIAEVLALIPHSVIDQVTAFEVEGPETSQDLDATWVVVNGGHHLAITTLYKNAA